MMHGRGKSDTAIVAWKPTNKADLSAAESVEPRAGTKGNADQQSTRRAQDRASVSQALEGIRQVAKQREKERFTSLLHHISIELLRLSYFELKKNAAAGGRLQHVERARPIHRALSGFDRRSPRPQRPDRHRHGQHRADHRRAVRRCTQQLLDQSAQLVVLYRQLAHLPCLPSPRTARPAPA